MSKLTLAQANTIINAAIDAARASDGPPIAVVVVDESGHVKASQREDGASMFRIDVSLGKAWGAVAMDTPSRKLAEKAKNNPAFISALTVTSGGRMLPNPGGVLIKESDGTIIGATGISGDTGLNDEIFACAGIEAAGLIPDAGTD